MAKTKQYVFSARVTQEGLKALNEVKSCFNIGWDELVIDAVSAHYNLDKAMMTLPKKEATAEPAKHEVEQPPANESQPEQHEATEHGQPAGEAPPEAEASAESPRTVPTARNRARRKKGQ